MAATHPIPTRNAIADHLLADLSGGQLVYFSASGMEIARLGFSTPAFASATGGRAKAHPIADDPGAAGGKIARAEFQTEAGIAKVLCSVTKRGGGGDIELDLIDIEAGQTVRTSELFYISPP